MNEPNAAVIGSGAVAQSGGVAAGKGAVILQGIKSIEGDLFIITGNDNTLNLNDSRSRKSLISPEKFNNQAFFGRDNEVSNWLNILDNDSLHIYGVPQIGKTLTAQKMMSKWLDKYPSGIVVYFKIPIRNEPLLLDKFIDYLAISFGRLPKWEHTSDPLQISQLSTEKKFDLVKQVLCDGKYLLCIDDFHLLEEGNCGEEVLPDIYQLLTQLHSYKVPVLTLGRMKPVITYGQTEELKGLSEEASKQILLSLTRDQTSDIYTFANDVVDYMYKVTDGHPFYLWLAGRDLLNRLKQTNRINDSPVANRQSSLKLQRVWMEDHHTESWIDKLDLWLDGLPVTDRVIMYYLALLNFPVFMNDFAQIIDGADLQTTYERLRKQQIIIENKSLMSADIELMDYSGTIEVDKSNALISLNPVFYECMINRQPAQALSQRDFHSKVAGYYRDKGDELRESYHVLASGELEPFLKLLSSDVAWLCKQSSIYTIISMMKRRLSEDSLVSASLGFQIASKIGQIYNQLGYLEYANKWMVEALDFVNKDSDNLERVARDISATHHQLAWIKLQLAKNPNEQQQAIDLLFQLSLPSSSNKDANVIKFERDIYHARILISPNSLKQSQSPGEFVGKIQQTKTLLDNIHQNGLLEQYRDTEPDLIGWFWHTDGLLHFYKSEHAVAIKSFDRAVIIRKEIKDLWNAGLSCMNVGNVYRQIGQPNQADQSWREAQKFFEESGNLNSLAYLQINLGHGAHLQCCYDQEHHLSNLECCEGGTTAFDRYSYALELANEMAILYVQLRAHEGLAYYYTRLGQWSKAKVHFDEALKIQHETEHDLPITLAHYAKYLLSRKRWKQAISLFGKLLQGSTDLPPDNHVELLWNRALANIGLGNYDAADSDLNEAEDIFKSEPKLTPWSDGLVHQIRGLLFIEIGKYEDAEKHLFEAEEVLDTRDKFEAARTKYLLAKLCFHLQQLDSSRSYLDEAAEIFKSLGTKPDIEMVEELERLLPSASHLDG